MLSYLELFLLFPSYFLVNVVTTELSFGRHLGSNVIKDQIMQDSLIVVVPTANFLIVVMPSKTPERNVTKEVMQQFQTDVDQTVNALFVEITLLIHSTLTSSNVTMEITELETDVHLLARENVVTRCSKVPSNATWVSSTAIYLHQTSTFAEKIVFVEDVVTASSILEKNVMKEITTVINPPEAVLNQMLVVLIARSLVAETRLLTLFSVKLASQTVIFTPQQLIPAPTTAQCIAVTEFFNLRKERNVTLEERIPTHLQPLAVQTARSLVAEMEL